MLKFLLCPNRDCPRWQFEAAEDCPECGTPGEDPKRITAYTHIQATLDRTYGTVHSPKYLESLGLSSTGKRDYERKMAEAGLRIKEKGEPSKNLERKKVGRERFKKNLYAAMEKHKGALNF